MKTASIPQMAELMTDLADLISLYRECSQMVPGEHQRGRMIIRDRQQQIVHKEFIQAFGTGEPE